MTPKKASSTKKTASAGKARAASKAASSKKATSKKATPKKTAGPREATTARGNAPGKKASTAKRVVSKGVAGKRATGNKAAAATSAVSSKFWTASRSRAEKIVKDPEKLQQIATESYESAAARSGPFEAVIDDFRTLVRLVVAYARGNYREIPADSLVVIVAGLVYVVSPLDLIPDVLPGGFVDDAAVVVWVVKSVRSELDAFRAWELGATAD